MGFNEIQIFLKQNITDLLSYLGAIQGFVLAVVVWNYPEQHKVSNRILSVFLFMLAFYLITPRIMEAVDSHFIRLMYGIRALGPIMLFLYIKGMYTKINWKRYLPHILVFLIDFFLIYQVIIIRASVLGEGTSWRFTGSTFEFFGITWYLFIFIFYLILSYGALKKYREKVINNFSSLNNIGLRWAKQIFVGFLILFLIDVLFSFISISFPEFYAPYHGLVNTISYTIFMYFVTIQGKLTPQIYKLRKIQEKPELPKDANNYTENKELKHLSERVIKLMEEEKLFREEGLSVREVADKLGEKSYLVSQAINSCLGQNFFELINRFRVEEAKKLLTDDSLNHLSIIGIGFEAGFSSKTAFNTAFKKYTGLTPSQYQKSCTVGV